MRKMTSSLKALIISIIKTTIMPAIMTGSVLLRGTKRMIRARRNSMIEDTNHVL